MIELLLTEDDIQLGMQKANTELSDFLETTRKSIIRTGQYPPETNKIVKESLEMLVTSYYSMTNKLKESKFFLGEEKRNLIVWNYSLSCASTSVLNLIERKIKREINFDNLTGNGINPINTEDLNSTSCYSVISNTLANLKKYINSARTGNLIYKLAFYFKNLESAAAYNTKIACSEECFKKELSQLEQCAKSKKISFNLKPRRKKTYKKTEQSDEEKEKVLLGDKMPDSLPVYEPNSARLDMVVGNKEQKNRLLDYIYMTFHYHPPSKKNFLWMQGDGFPEGVLLYGDAGVGKTFMANALMNKAVEIANKKNLDFLPVSLDGHNIASVYQNRSGAILEHYFSMIRRGDKAHTVLIDEFDDLIPMGSNGRISENARQRLSAFKRVTGNSSALGNYFLIAIANRISEEDDIPIEIKNRLTPIYIPGPQTPEEYGQIIKNGFYIKEKLGLIDPKIDWSEIGNYVIQWKNKLNSYQNKEVAVGRGYKMITQQLATKTKIPFRENSVLLGKSPESHKKYYSKEFTPITQEELYHAIDRAMNNLIESNIHTKPGEYGNRNIRNFLSIPKIS